MSTRFTKGKWFVNSTGSKTWVDTETGFTIAQVFDVEGHSYDANLIATAPDMYEALRSICNGEGLQPGTTIEGILAKARGEQ